MTFQTHPEAFGDVMTRSVLIVDDLEANRALLERRLEKFGYRILSADGGETALRMLDREKPDVILLDYMMPQMNGLEVLSRIRANDETRNIPVIMVTARAEAEALVAALDSGADDYVTKPIDFDVLRARMETHMGKRKATSDLARANAVLDQRVTLRSMALADLEGELQDEKRKRMELEAHLGSSTRPPLNLDDERDALESQLAAVEQGLADMFGAVSSGKSINAAKLLSLKSEIAKVRSALRRP